LYDGGYHSVSRYGRARTEGAEVSNGRFAILEKPENNVEPASISSFWIYTLALFTGLLIPVSREITRNFRGYILPADLFNCQNLSTVSNIGLRLSE
jgi:hypothetical protein